MLFYKKNTLIRNSNNLKYQKDSKKKINILNERLAERRVLRLQNPYIINENRGVTLCLIGSDLFKVNKKKHWNGSIVITQLENSNHDHRDRMEMLPQLNAP